ncbi:flavin reductase family protein [Amycolatopsis acidicola]|nr:flavin reductase family protein [Amycolatopsis acidicola]
MTETNKTGWWKTVLGEFPTGVTLISSVDVRGEPVAMVVGTFTAVSQDPPLVGFFPGRESGTFPRIADAGRFTASVLGDGHEELCRAVAKKDADRFAKGAWVTGEAGIPRPAGALAWFDADITQVTSLGDHSLAVGKVTAFGVGNGDSGLPLLFLRGGYGRFAAPGTDLDPARLARRLAIIENGQGTLDALARRIGRRVRVSGVAGDSVVALGGASPRPAKPLRAAVFPFAAPFGSVFVAWDDERRRTWTENSRHLVGAVDRAAIGSVLERTRARGYGISTGFGIARRFEGLAGGSTAARGSFVNLWRELAAAASPAAGDPAEITSIQVPVFGPAGSVELALVLDDIRRGESPAVAVQLAGELLRAAGELSRP